MLVGVRNFFQSPLGKEVACGMKKGAKMGAVLGFVGATSTLMIGGVCLSMFGAALAGKKDVPFFTHAKGAAMLFLEKNEWKSILKVTAIVSIGGAFWGGKIGAAKHLARMSSVNQIANTTLPNNPPSNKF